MRLLIKYQIQVVLFFCHQNFSIPLVKSNPENYTETNLQNGRRKIGPRTGGLHYGTE